METFDVSMKYLGLEHVDLLSIHGINNQETFDQSMRDGGCLEAAREIQRQGRARFIGFSTHGGTEIIVRAIETFCFIPVDILDPRTLRMPFICNRSNN